MTKSRFFPAQSNCFAKFVDSFKGHKVAVLGHQRPDGDCVGSTVALVRMLRSLGFDCIGLNRDATPAALSTFLGDTPMALAENFTPCGHVAFSVDCADFKRVGSRLNELFPKVALNVDHHISNKLYGTENLVIATASATAEILAGFYFDNDYPIDAVTAQALYLGIATDTGQFRFPSTTPSTFEIARRLCEQGANPSAAAYELYEKESFAKIQLLKNFLDSLTMEFGGLVCIGLIKEGDYKTTGATIDDSEGLVDYARAIDGVEIGVMLEERNGAIKGSLRSSDPKFRVDQIAKEFGGGGHACAAGLNLDCSTIEEFLPQLRSAIDKCLKELKK